MCQLSLFIIVLSTAFCYTIAQDVCSAECVKALLTPEQGLISLIVRLTNKNSTEIGNYSFLINELPSELRETMATDEEAEQYIAELHTTVETFQDMSSRSTPSRLTAVSSYEMSSSERTKVVSGTTRDRDREERFRGRRPIRNEEAYTSSIEVGEINGNLDYPIELQSDGRIMVTYHNKRYDINNLPGLLYKMTTEERTKLIRELRVLGFPVDREGRRISQTTYTSSKFSFSWKSTQNGQKRILINDEEFILPDENSRLSDYLKRQPRITYDFLKKMKTSGIAFDVDRGLEQPLAEDSYFLKSERKRMYITIRGVDYEIPNQLPELSRQVSREELRRIYATLQRDGFPVGMNGDVITGGSDDVSSEYVTDMEVQSSEGTVIITIDGQKYRVPKQRESLLRLMHERPELRYEILKIFREHNMAVNVNTLDVQFPENTDRYTKTSQGSMSGEQVSAADYDLITTKEGDMEILVAGTNLKVPEDLPRLSQLVSSTTLVLIVTRLKEIGIPVSVQNNRVIVQTERTTSYRIEVEAKTRNKVLVSVIITMNGERYVLPKDADAFQAAIHREPAMTFQLFKLLAKYHIPVEFNEKSGQVTFTFETEEEEDDDEDDGSSPDVPYEILSQNGKIIIRIGSEDLVIPRDLQRLSGILSTQNLQKLVGELKSFGTPVELRGSRIVITREQKTSYRIALQVATFRKQPIRAIVSINNDRYELPRDEERFQAFLMRVPAVKYKIFQLLSSKNIPMRYDNETKRLQIKFANMASRPAPSGVIPPVFLRQNPGQQNSLMRREH